MSGTEAEQAVAVTQPGMCQRTVQIRTRTHAIRDSWGISAKQGVPLVTHGGEAYLAMVCTHFV